MPKDDPTEEGAEEAKEAQSTENDLACVCGAVCSSADGHAVGDVCPACEGDALKARDEGAEEEAAAPAAEQGEGEESHITDADAEEIARQASRSVSFRAVVKGPQVATNTDSQDCFKVSLSVTGGTLNLYELHQQVARFANNAVSVTLTPVPEGPATPQPHPDQLEFAEGEEAPVEVVELVMCPDCSGAGTAVVKHEGDEDVEGKCPACEGEGEIPLAKLAETTFRLLRCEGCGACFSTKDAENAQPGQACPSCEDAILAFVEPPTEEPAAEAPAGEPAEEAEAAE